MLQKICIITGSRAEYGLLKNLIIALRSLYDTKLIVTGSHLSSYHGMTYNMIEEDGIFIDYTVDMQINGDSQTDIVYSMGIEMMELSNIFADYRPDLLIILGDRYEIMVAALCATIFKIPIAHLCGGDITIGANDDCMRNAITKMSHIHFVTSESAATRVTDMKEQNVYVVGHPGLEDMKITMYRDELCNKLNITLSDINFMVIYHPTTLGITCIDNLLSVLSIYKNVKIIFIGSNTDTQNLDITRKIQEFAYNTRNYFYNSLDRQTFINLCNECDVIIGNSSSGIYEAPIIGIPTVNIGNRQVGREFSNSIFQVDDTVLDIKSGIQNALNFRDKIECKYIKLDTTTRIINILSSFKNITELLVKS